MKKYYEYLVIGAGPAGLQLGYFLERNKRDYCIVESGPSVGTFFKRFPRHRTLISANKVYTGYDDKIRNLRWDWNSLIDYDHDVLFKEYSKEYFPPADVMSDYLSDFAKINKLNIEFNCKVTSVSKDGLFTVELDGSKEVTCKILVVATGVSKPYVPNIPGIELAELYTEMSVDPNDFVDKKVLIVGKGNSAFETADNLISTASRIYVCSPTPITLSWKSKFVGHLRAINNNFIDTYQLKLQNVMLDANLTKIEKSGDALKTTFHYVHADDEIEEMEFDKVLLCTGFQLDKSIFQQSARPDLRLNNRFPALKNNFESKNVNDMYFAGTLMQERDYRKKQSGFIHGFRHNIESLSNFLEKKYHGVSWPSLAVKKSSEDIAKLVLERSNMSPGLWQQTGFLCDVIAKKNDSESFEYFVDVPTNLVEEEFSEFEFYHIVTLEFGLDIIYASPDPLAVDRIHKDDVDGARLSTGIHPIIRTFLRGNLVSEHHVLEDIIPEWTEDDVHFNPLVQYLNQKFDHKVVENDDAESIVAS